MPQNTNPIFVLTPNTGRATIAAANTASNGSGTLVDLITGSTNGTRVDSITVTNSQLTYAASSAMVVRVFITDSSGLTPKLLQEMSLPAATRSASVVGTTNTINFAGGLFLVSGQKLQVCQSVYASAADQNDVIAKGGNY